MGGRARRGRGGSQRVLLGSGCGSGCKLLLQLLLLLCACLCVGVYVSVCAAVEGGRVTTDWLGLPYFFVREWSCSSKETLSINQGTIASTYKKAILGFIEGVTSQAGNFSYSY